MVKLEKPCEVSEHKMYGFTFLSFDLNTNEEPIPKSENNDRILFFGCTGCDDDLYYKLLPNCPKFHHPYRYYANDQIGCRACAIYVTIPP